MSVNRINALINFHVLQVILNFINPANREDRLLNFAYSD
jgi:hypothetical protein